MIKYSAILFCFFSSLSLFGQTDQWYLQIAVFEEQVETNYFKDIEGSVLHAKDGFGFHRYYKEFSNEADANSQMKQLENMGYNCLMISRNELTSTCRCNRIPVPKSMGTTKQFDFDVSQYEYPSSNVLTSIRHIFFDFDRADLKDASISQLSKLASLLNKYPDYRVDLLAHTDAKGSSEYNQYLSLRRANAAKKYLREAGIAPSRITAENFGEAKPIAKNEVNGRDTELGRQFNRRVEIVIYDEKNRVLNDMVSSINVPQDLKY